jgi:hypothetical protein
MDENVFAVFPGDKTKTLRLVEPLYRSICHARYLLS